MSNSHPPRREPRIGRTLMRLTLKLIAVLVVMAAIALPRGTAHDRVMVLVLEGAHGDVVRRLARAGHLPTLEKVIAGGVGGDIVGAADTIASDELLERIVSVASSDEGGQGQVRSPLWELLSRQARPFFLSSVPGVDLDNSAGAISLPGPNTAAGFIGPNTGLVVNSRTIERNAVTWPYSTVSAGLRSAAAAALSARAVQWVQWRDASNMDPRSGVFAVYALDDDTVYLTPVYTRVVDDAAVPGVRAGHLYIGDDPTRVVVSSRTAEFLPRHAADLADARTEVATTLAESRAWDLLVHVDRRIAITEAALATGTERHAASEPAGEEELPGTLVDAYADVDTMVARWLEIAGARTAVLVIGITEPPRVRGEPSGWFAVASVVGDLGSWGPVTADDLSATLSYLLSFDAGAEHAPLAAVSARFPLRSRFNFASFVGRRSGVSVPADARALQDLIKTLADERH